VNFSIKELLFRGASRLMEAKVKKFERDARILLSHALEKDKVFILAHPEFQADRKTARGYFSFIERRAGGEPIQYITGIQPFWTTEIKVGRGCLIPRPETEILVEEVLKIAGTIKKPRIVDLGCGSGAILKALASSLHDCGLVGLEKEKAAMTWAKLNLEGFKNVELIKGDFSEDPLISGADIIVSNPPYLTKKEFEALPVEIKKYEPKEALLAENPIEPYRHIARVAGKALKTNGFIVVEIGSAQAIRLKAVVKAFEPFLFSKKIRDYGGRLRVLVFQKEN
jgi:release factor glutamine methyltransferase